MRNQSENGICCAGLVRLCTAFVTETEQLRESIEHCKSLNQPQTRCYIQRI